MPLVQLRTQLPATLTSQTSSAANSATQTPKDPSIPHPTYSIKTNPHYNLALVCKLFLLFLFFSAAAASSALANASPATFADDPATASSNNGAPTRSTRLRTLCLTVAPSRRFLLQMRC